MNGKNLFMGLSYIDPKFIEEAQTDTIRARTSGRKRLRKPLLAAAIIAMTLLLVGCAVVYVMSLQDVVITQDAYTPPAAPGESTGPAQIRNIISLQGYAGPPGYQATKEWYEFRQTYQYPDDGAEIPMEERLDYLAYGCFFQEEIDKVDEICEKYGLNKLGIGWIEEEPETTFEALGIHGLLLPGAQADVRYSQGYYYWDGTFDIPFDLTLTGEDTPWKFPLSMSLRYVMKTSFDGVYGFTGPLESYEEWTYTTAQGVDVLMALSEDNARMIVDQQDAFLTVFVNNVRAGDISDGERKLTRAGLEAAAEVIDFRVDPQEVDVEAAQARYEALGDRLDKEREEREKALENYGYKDRIIELAQSGYDPIRAVYALLDIDGNGVEELLLGEEDYFYNVCTLDGTRSKSVIWWIDNTKVYVCEGGILMHVDDGLNGKHYRFAKLTGTDIEYLDWIKQDPQDTGNPWKRVCKKNDDGTVPQAFSPKDQNLVDQSISEDAFNKVLASYQKIEIETTPIQEYLAAIGHPFIQDSIGDYLMHYLENSENPEKIRYALHDLNGDGEAELLLGGGDTPFGEVVMLVDGMIDLVISDGTLNGLYLCEDNIVEKHYTADTFESHIYYRIEGHEAVEIDQICYDAFSNPENPWYRYHSEIGKASYEERLSVEEYNAAIASHPRVHIEMKPITEFS